MSVASFVQVLKTCEAAEGGGSKAVIKAALASLDKTGQELYKFAMDPFKVYGVKKYPVPRTHAATDPDDGFELIAEVLADLESRRLTGNAARDTVTRLLSAFTSESAEYIARIIDKDVDAKFSPETYNKIHEANPVPVFDVMLADKCVEDEDFDDLSFPRIADVKYDGERNVCFQLLEESNFAPAGSSYRSRSGKTAEHMAGLFDEDLAKIREYLGYDFVLDGERMAKDYTETTNAKKTGKEGEAGKKNMRFRAFFLMPLSDWVSQKTAITMEQARAHLIEILAACKCEKIIVSDAVIVNNFTEMRKELQRVTTPGFDGMPKGQEGLILKKPDAVYRWDRSLDWCKVKNFYDADARILGWEFGKKSNKDKMGKVMVAGWLEDGTYFEVSVGSGWTKAQRIDFVTNFEAKWKGKTIVVWYQEATLGKHKKHYSLRFPTVDQEKLLRDDKVVPINLEA